MIAHLTDPKPIPYLLLVIISTVPGKEVHLITAQHGLTKKPIKVITRLLEGEDEAAAIHRFEKEMTKDGYRRCGTIYHDYDYWAEQMGLPIRTTSREERRRLKQAKHLASKKAT
jgi:hypothetical protein